ncbi:MAG: hypothetical protein ABSG68_16155 [Thermoguttaceae bacterium]|jgi:hypothetical protein
MHACELVELSAILSGHGPVLIRGIQRISPQALQQYWTASKCRLDRWTASLKGFADDAVRLSPQQVQAHWPHTRGVLEEILTSEVLTRVWTAILCACDRREGIEEAGPIARSVLIGHVEARHRVLVLLVRGPGIHVEAAVKLNHLRRRAERWTDMLIGYLAGLVDVGEFAVEPQRARDFAQDLQYQSGVAGGRHAWPLLLASIRAAFGQGLMPYSPNADLNERIASSILACFPAELFDATGLFRSLWLLRLSNVTSDVQGMVEDLLSREA